MIDLDSLRQIGDSRPDLKEALAGMDAAMTRLRDVSAAAVRDEVARTADRLKALAGTLADDPALTEMVLSLLLGYERGLGEFTAVLEA